MCRLFGLHAGAADVAATFWLLDAPDSLAAQSHRNPDGAGIGVFGAGRRTHRQQAADRGLGRRRLRHERAPTTRYDVRRARPLRQHRRAHGREHTSVPPGRTVVRAQRCRPGAGRAGCPAGRARMPPHLVQGQTDSERVFALITAETQRHEGDVGRGLVEAIALGRRPAARSMRSTWSWPRRPTCGRCVIRRPTSSTCWSERPAAPAIGHVHSTPGATDPRAVRRAVEPGLRAGGQRTHGRRSGLATARAGRAGPRRLGAAGPLLDAVPGRAAAPAHPRRPRPGQHAAVTSSPEAADLGRPADRARDRPFWSNALGWEHGVRCRRSGSG